MIRGNNSPSDSRLRSLEQQAADTGGPVPGMPSADKQDLDGGPGGRCAATGIAHGGASGSIESLATASPPPSDALITTADSSATAVDDGVTDANGAPSLSEPSVLPAQLSGYDVAALLTYFTTDSTNKKLKAQQDGILANQTTARAIGQKNLNDIQSAIKAAAKAAAKRRASHGWGLFKRIFQDISLTVCVTLVTVLKNPQSLENPATLFMLAQVSMQVMIEVGKDCGVDLEPSHLMATVVAKALEACDEDMDHGTAMAWGKTIAFGAMLTGGGCALIALDPTIAGEGVAGILTLEGHTSDTTIAAWSMGVSAAVGIAVAIALITVEGTKAAKTAETEAAAADRTIDQQVVDGARLAEDAANAKQQVRVDQFRKFAGHVARAAKVGEGIAQMGEAGLDIQAAFFERDAADSRADQIVDKALTDFVNHNLQAAIKAMKQTNDTFTACMDVVKDILKGYSDSMELLGSHIGQSAA